MDEFGVRFLIRPGIVMRGLDPRIHLQKSTFSKRMDCRGKPGNDDDYNRAS
jgi:hypothetical protein